MEETDEILAFLEVREEEARKWLLITYYL